MGNKESNESKTSGERNPGCQMGADEHTVEMSQKMAKEGPRLSKNQKFSEHFSIHCCPPFTFLNSKREIVDRKYSICKSGCFYQKKEEDWICCACQKTSIEKEEQVNPKEKVTEKGLLVNGQPRPADFLLPCHPSALRRIIWPRV
ncbi:Myelin-associated oligodendrocyte basic protein [Apodemus speciosus]|uniref:Myelin-associated oligodendrocyte basic protein n=1 Tax=Apodemus speciosus TaxID=105296 RepID=A0ABQ0F6B5_APOSI